MFKKILVCLDGSSLAEQILPYAVEQARRCKSELLLFRVLSMSSPVSVAIPGMPGLPLETKAGEKHFAAEEKESETYLKSLAGRLQSENKLKVSYDKVLGAAGPSIVEYSGKNGIELIAIATHGRSGPGRVILGSVADHIIRHANIPILLIRPTGESTK
jgi:nucleotide-binding universal stress UspA family protein